MATAPTLPLVTVEDYFKNGLWKEWEYDNGTLVPRYIGSNEHSRLIIDIGHLIKVHDWLRPYATFVVNIPWDRCRYRVPDVCCYPANGIPSEDLEQQTPPIAVIEVLSKNDPMQEMRSKCEDYTRLGVPHIFIVNPADRGILVPHGIRFLPVEKIEIVVGEKRAEISIEDLFGPA